MGKKSLARYHGKRKLIMIDSAGNQREFGGEIVEHPLTPFDYNTSRGFHSKYAFQTNEGEMIPITRTGSTLNRVRLDEDRNLVGRLLK